MAARANGDLRLFINSLDNTRIAETPDDALSVSELRTRGAALFYECTMPALARVISVMDRARRLNPDDGMSQAMWGLALIEWRSYRFEPVSAAETAEVAAAMDLAVERLPRSDFVFFARSQFRPTVLGDAEAARADAERSLAINPGYALGQMGVGMSCLRAGSFAEAAAAFDLASQDRNDPFWALRRYLAALSLYCGGAFDRSLETLRDLIDIKPTVAGFRKLLALGLDALERNAEAAEARAAAAELPDTPSIFVMEPFAPEPHQWLCEALAPKDLGGR